METALHCPTCGYNLTGLRESRCPECGKAYDSARIASGEVSRRGFRPVIYRLILGAALLASGFGGTLITEGPAILLAAMLLVAANAVLLSRRLEWLDAGMFGQKWPLAKRVGTCIRLALVQLLFAAVLAMVVLPVLAWLA